MHPDIEAALADWWVAEQLLRSVPWAEYPHGERRTHLHTKTRTGERDAKDRLFLEIERRQGTTIKPPPRRPPPPETPGPHDDGDGPDGGIRITA